MLSGIDRRRTIRIRRSSLLKSKLEKMDRPAIKVAESPKEYRQAFRIVYDEYLKETYAEPHPSGMLYSAYNLLPKTVTMIFKSYLDTVSTVSLVPDTRLFGLPMDVLYKKELRPLREAGRTVAEIGGLATRRMNRWSNLLIYMARALYRYAMFADINDVVIMVNPKHVRFYTHILLFEPFGEERYYGSVGAPAVALRINMDKFTQRLQGAYAEADFETDLYSFFVKVHNDIVDLEVEYSAVRNRPLDMALARELFRARPELLENMTPEQREYMEVVYHRALFRSHFFCKKELVGNA